MVEVAPLEMTVEGLKAALFRGPDALKPDPRDLAAVRAATLPRLLGIATTIAQVIEREGVDLSNDRRKDTTNAR